MGERTVVSIEWEDEQTLVIESVDPKTNERTKERYEGVSIEAPLMGKCEDGSVVYTEMPVYVNTSPINVPDQAGETEDSILTKTIWDIEERIGQLGSYHGSVLSTLRTIYQINRQKKADHDKAEVELNPTQVREFFDKLANNMRKTHHSDKSTSIDHKGGVIIESEFFTKEKKNK